MLLKLLNIHKSFGEKDSRNFREVLRDISFELDEGKSLAILGPSGSGKSTLLNMIGALDQPDSGQVLFDGEVINLLKEKQLTAFRKNQIGFVFQSHHLLPQCNVLENVLIPSLPTGKNMEGRAKELIKKVGLQEHQSDFPTTLSGGECQRVAVVRALINQPRLLLADEPTGSLDHENAQSIIDLLLNLKMEFNLAMIVVTHSQEIASRMDGKYLLEDGQLKPSI